MNKVHLEEKLIHLKAMNTGHEPHLFQVVITFTLCRGVSSKQGGGSVVSGW